MMALQVAHALIWDGRVVRWYNVNFSAGANLDNSRAGAYLACNRCGMGLFGHFFNSHLSFLSSFSLSLGDGPI